MDLLFQAASVGCVQTAVARLEKPVAKGKLLALEISATIVVEVLLSFI
jgi:hypothetical protein